MSGMASKEDRIRAYHEAGHAVVARALGIGVVRAAGFSTGPDNAGQVLTAFEFDDDLPAQLAAIWKDLAVALAGPRAENRYRYGPATSWSAAPFNIDWIARASDGWAGDIKNAKMLAIRSVRLKEGSLLPIDGLVEASAAQMAEANRLLEQSWQETGVLVGQHWPAIERVANALLGGRMLDQDALDALIADSPASNAVVRFMTKVERSRKKAQPKPPTLAAWAASDAPAEARHRGESSVRAPNEAGEASGETWEQMWARPYEAPGEGG
jgi:hypothetical protein